MESIPFAFVQGGLDTNLLEGHHVRVSRVSATTTASQSQSQSQLHDRDVLLQGLLVKCRLESGSLSENQLVRTDDGRLHALPKKDATLFHSFENDGRSNVRFVLKRETEIELSYVTQDIFWTPIFKLIIDRAGKKKTNEFQIDAHVHLSGLQTLFQTHKEEALLSTVQFIASSHVDAVNESVFNEKGPSPVDESATLGYRTMDDWLPLMFPAKSKHGQPTSLTLPLFTMPTNITKPIYLYNHVSHSWDKAFVCMSTTEGHEAVQTLTRKCCGRHSAVKCHVIDTHGTLLAKLPFSLSSSPFSSSSSSTSTYGEKMLCLKKSSLPLSSSPLFMSSNVDKFPFVVDIVSISECKTTQPPAGLTVSKGYRLECLAIDLSVTSKSADVERLLFTHTMEKRQRFLATVPKETEVVVVETSPTKEKNQHKSERKKRDTHSDDSDDSDDDSDNDSDDDTGSSRRRFSMTSGSRSSSVRISSIIDDVVETTTSTSIRWLLEIAPKAMKQCFRLCIFVERSKNVSITTRHTKGRRNDRHSERDSDRDNDRENERKGSVVMQRVHPHSSLSSSVQPLIQPSIHQAHHPQPAYVANNHMNQSAEQMRILNHDYYRALEASYANQVRQPAYPPFPQVPSNIMHNTMYDAAAARAYENAVSIGLQREQAGLT